MFNERYIYKLLRLFDFVSMQFNNFGFDGLLLFLNVFYKNLFFYYIF